MRRSMLAGAGAVAAVVTALTWHGLSGDRGPAPAAGADGSPGKGGATLSRLWDGGPRHRDVIVPAGTRLSLTLETGVASDTSHVEDPVRARTRAAVVVDGIEVVPAGSALSGTVRDAERSGRVSGRARVAFAFDELRLASTGERYDIRTTIIVRQAPGSKKDDARTIAVPAAGGAIVGAIAGGKKGAAIGGAVGGGAGTALVLTTRGEEVRLGPGATVTVDLRAPVTIRIPVTK